MNSHKNARLTFVRRREMVLAIEKKELTRVEAAVRFGVSLRTVQKWLRRFRLEGLEGLCDRSSRPHSNPRAISQSEAERMLSLRTAGFLGQEIAKAVGRARSTVSRVLRFARLSTQKQLDRDPSPKRYEHAHPGDMIHLDIKKLGKFNKPGHRVMKRADPRYSASSSGWEFVHVCIDDHSRFSYMEVLDEGETAAATSGFLRRAAKFFHEMGVELKRVLTDNGSGYKSNLFKEAVDDLGLKHSTTRPYTPKTNGKAERFIQTVQREWAYVKEYDSSQQRRRALPSWLNRYNNERPHAGIGGKSPCSRIKQR